MSRCLYCGNELPVGSRAHFCKSSGHHILYKRALLDQLSMGTISREGVDHLIMFGWVPNNYVVTESQENPLRKRRGRPVGSKNGNASAPKKVREAKKVGFEVPFRKFGVEIECFIPHGTNNEVVAKINGAGYNMQSTGYTHTDCSYWKSLYDSSIRPDLGYDQKEFVSPPFATVDGFKEVSAVCDLIKDSDGRVNYSTGTHVHLDASDLTAKDIAKIVYFYGRFERQINSLFPESRRKNSYCKSVKKMNSFVDHRVRFYDDAFDYFSSISDVTRVLCSRYVKVNVHAFLRHGTVEFRQHGGTLDGNAIEMWTKLCTRIVEYVKAGNDVNAKGNLFKLLGCESNELEYWTKVKEEVAA